MYKPSRTAASVVSFVAGITLASIEFWGIAGIITGIFIFMELGIFVCAASEQPVLENEPEDTEDLLLLEFHKRGILIPEEVQRLMDEAFVAGLHTMDMEWKTAVVLEEWSKLPK